MSAYYNENDRFAAQWLRELIKAGLISDGYVDERSIEDVRPADLTGYSQCHFFAGIGVWSHALRGSGWADDREVWTGSCPCQPFSSAGKRAGTADKRHLWPVLKNLIDECRPQRFFGEQVASPDGLAWFDNVRTDLEKADYAVGAVDLCAAGFGAPHIRQRLFFVGERVAHTNSSVSDKRRADVRGRIDGGDAQARTGLGCGELPGGLANASSERLHRWGSSKEGNGRNPARVEPKRLCDASGLGNADCESAWRHSGGAHSSQAKVDESHPCDSNGLGHAGDSCRPGPTNGHWANADWLLCRDGKWRPTEPELKPLVNGSTNRMGKLRGYGNAIVASVAKEFIAAYLDFDYQKNNRGDTCPQHHTE